LERLRPVLNNLGFIPGASPDDRLNLTRRDFLRLAGLTAAGLGAKKLSRLGIPEAQAAEEWPPETVKWKMDPEKGISQFTAWEENYPDDPFPGIMEFTTDPKGMFTERGLWSNIAADLTVPDWDGLKDILWPKNIRLNDFIFMIEDYPAGLVVAKEYIEAHLNDMVAVPPAGPYRDAFIELYADIAVRQLERIYPPPMADFEQAVEVPARVEMDFWLGNQWETAGGQSAEFGDNMAFLNVLSVFDTVGADTYYPIALINLAGSPGNFKLQCRSSGDARPDGIQTEDTMLELTLEGNSRPIGLDSKISLRCELWPGDDRGFFVYVKDEEYSPEFVLYAAGQYSGAAAPKIESIHSGLYHGWVNHDHKLKKGSIFLGGLTVSSNPDATLPTPIPTPTSTVTVTATVSPTESPSPTPSPTPMPPEKQYKISIPLGMNKP